MLNNNINKYLKTIQLSKYIVIEKKIIQISLIGGN